MLALHSRNRNFEEAERLFQSMRSSGKIDSIAITTIMKARADNWDIDGVKEIFEWAKEQVRTTSRGLYFFHYAVTATQTNTRSLRSLLAAEVHARRETLQHATPRVRQERRMAGSEQRHRSYGPTAHRTRRHHLLVFNERPPEFQEVRGVFGGLRISP